MIQVRSLKKRTLRQSYAIEMRNTFHWRNLYIYTDAVQPSLELIKLPQYGLYYLSISIFKQYLVIY